MAKKPRGGSRAGNYKVGYGKPPIATRFKPGQSGNPRGRPRLQEGPAEILKRALLRQIPTKEGDVVRRRTAMEVMFHNLVAKAAKGDTRAVNTVMKHTQDLNIPFQDINRSIRVRFVKSTHPRPPGARPPRVVTDDDIDYLNKLYSGCSEEERRRVIRDRKIVLAERRLREKEALEENEQ